MAPNAALFLIKEGPWMLHTEFENSQGSGHGLGNSFPLRGIMVMLQAQHLKGVCIWPLFHTPANKNKKKGTFLAGQWLRLHTVTAEGPCSIPRWGTKIPHDTWPEKKKKKKNICSLFSERCSQI